MANRRDQIKMSGEEIERFLAEQRVANVATAGADGWPHLTALWYVMRDGEPWIYTYAKSQKVRNIERDDRATLLVESGHNYNELRGVMIKARAHVHHELEVVAPLAEEITRKYVIGSDAEIDERARAVLRSQAAKRAAIQFTVEELVSWDHAKLGGTY
jgi:PPOX class probable F420-dependent enzyme